MILNHLARHVLARRHSYSASSWVLCVLRSARVLVYYRAHRRLCALALVRHYVARPGNDDLFHHLSHRHYLAKHFSARQRVRLLFQHYRFEEERFDEHYKHHVYLGRGLVLWEHRADGIGADLLLTVATRHNAEGDLTLTLRVDGQRLHRVSFSWVDGVLAGLPGCTLPYIARNQGHGATEQGAFVRFNQAFPNNSPSYFCLAGMQGIAQAIAAPQLLAVSTDAQVASRRAPGKFFHNAYDGLWSVLGGEAVDRGRAFRIPVPFHQKPLDGMASKHRKRASQRRAHWQAIAAAAEAALAGCVRAPASPAPSLARTADA